MKMQQQLGQVNVANFCCIPGLPLRTEAPAMTPNGRLFLFCFFPCCIDKSQWDLVVVLGKTREAGCQCQCCQKKTNPRGHQSKEASGPHQCTCTLPAVFTQIAQHAAVF